MAGRAGVEPTTLRLKAIDSTKAPPCPTYVSSLWPVIIPIFYAFGPRLNVIEDLWFKRYVKL